MTRVLVGVIACFPTAPAWAHGGHLADVAGHDHWIALGALGVAAALGLWTIFGGEKDGDKERSTGEQEAAEDSAPEDAPA